MKLVSSMVMVASAAVLVAGCAGYTGTSTARAGRSPGQFVDDKAIRDKVAQELKQDPTVSAFPIDVRTYQQDVQLSGFVEFPVQAQRAEEIARSVPNVTSVRNDIVVKREMGLDAQQQQAGMGQQQQSGGGYAAGQADQRSYAESGQVSTQPGQQQLQSVRGTIVGSPEQEFRIRTDDGIMAVDAGNQWESQKGQLNLKQGDSVQIRGYYTGFGAERHIVAQEITANGKTVRLENQGQPYRETGQQQQPQSR